MKLLGNLHKGLIFVVSAPAGTGKTTLVQMLVQEFPCVIQSVSYTTRPKRYNESSGDHYHFITPAAFEKKIGEHEFLEYVKLYDDYYGTSKKWVAEKQAQGFHIILVIDTQGALQLVASLDARFIFIAPPSLEELKQRLIKRNTDTKESITKRLDWAEKEMDAAHYYDYKIVNDSLDVAYQTLRSIVVAEEHRVRVKPTE
jgi:guanylate kinase